MGDVGAMIKKPNFALKCVQLVLAIISTGLVINYPVADNFSSTATVNGTQIGFLMISIIVILSFVMGTPLHKNLLLIIGGIGCVMWVTAGALIINTYLDAQVTIGGYTFKLKDRLIASGVLSLINGAVYLVDTGLTLKG